MDYLTAILLGVVQGTSEFLPISSDGHLVIAEALLSRWNGSPPNTHNIAWMIALHIGTLLSILVVFRTRLLEVLRRPRLLLAVIVATLPLVVVGLLWKDEVDRLFDSTLAAGIGLCGTAVLMALAGRVEHGELTLGDVRPRDALLIGLLQTLAVLPGVSRSGSTIFGGLATGLQREAAAHFSFYIAVPALAGAAVLHARDLLEQGPGNVPPGPLLAGALTAFVVGVFALQMLLRLVTRRKLHWFAWYCAIVGVATIVWQLAG